MQIIARLIVAIIAAPILAVALLVGALYAFVSILFDLVTGNVPKLADKAK